MYRLLGNQTNCAEGMFSLQNRFWAVEWWLCLGNSVKSFVSLTNGQYTRLSYIENRGIGYF